MTQKIPRKQQILEALASQLEQSPGARITTALLARASGVTEAALYRHFPSKARMFEELIAFAEESVFSRVNQILADEKETGERCSRMIYLLLGFAERNPGITRLLLGDVLAGEDERLQGRVDRFFDRLETQFRQILREARLRESRVSVATPEESATLLLALVEGRLRRFVRSRFRDSPLAGWEVQWRLLEPLILT